MTTKSVFEYCVRPPSPVLISEAERQRSQTARQSRSLISSAAPSSRAGSARLDSTGRKTQSVGRMLTQPPRVGVEQVIDPALDTGVEFDEADPA